MLVLTSPLSAELPGGRRSPRRRWREGLRWRRCPWSRQVAYLPSWQQGSLVRRPAPIRQAGRGGYGLGGPLPSGRASSNTVTDS